MSGDLPVATEAEADRKGDGAVGKGKKRGQYEILCT